MRTLTVLLIAAVAVALVACGEDNPITNHNGDDGGESLSCDDGCVINADCLYPNDVDYETKLVVSGDRGISGDSI